MMIVNPNKYHMVHYRRVAAKESDPTFEALCRGALSAQDPSGRALWQRPLDRMMRSSEGDAGRQIVMNRVADLSSAVFGEICFGIENDLQALLRLDTQEVRLSALTTATVFDLSESKAPQGSQFIRGTGYWLAIGNHLFSIQLGSLTVRLTQEYLAWLVSSEARRLGVERTPSDFLIEIDVAEVGNDGIGDIRNLRVKGKSARGVVVPVDQNTTPKKRKFSRSVSKEHKVSDRALPLANAILGEARTRSLVKSLGPEEYLTAEGEVRVAGSRTDASREQIRKIAHEIADETDAEVTVEGKFGKIKNGDVILRTKMPFATPNNGGTLLDFDNVADQMQEVYKRFVNDEKIKP